MKFENGYTGETLSRQKSSYGYFNLPIWEHIQQGKKECLE